MFNNNMKRNMNNRNFNSNNSTPQNSNLQNMNIPADKQDDLLKMAGKQLGKDPNQIKQQLQNGNVDQFLATLTPQQAAQVKSVLSNQQLMNQIMSNPQVAKFLGNMNNNNK